MSDDAGGQVVREHRVRAALWLVAFAVLASACGARVSDQQIQAAGGGGGTGAPAAGAGSNLGAEGGGEALAPGEPAPVEAAGPEAGPAIDGGGGGDPAAPADPGAAPAPGAPGAPAPAAAPGDNGGATDVGVTGNEVLLSNISTLSGPVPGIFQGAVLGAQAVVAYQNSLGGVHGRKMKLVVGDDQFDSGQNRALTNAAVGKAFAFLGSFSLFDDTGAEAITKANMPDLTFSLSDARRKVPTNFSIEPATPGGWQLSYLQWLKDKYPGAVGAVGSLYPDVASGKANYLAAKRAAESLGFKFAYDRAIQPTETDFTADVVRMRQSGVKMVYLPAADVKVHARLAKAFAQQGFKPEAFIGGGAAYDVQLVPLAGAENVEGMVIPQIYSAFAGEDAAANPEVALFLEWIKKVKPGYTPDLFAMFSWAEGRLLFRAMEMAGPKLTRAGVNDAIRKIDMFDANGLVAPASPARKLPPTCFIVLTVKGGKYQRLDPAKGYRCEPGGYFKG